MAFFNHSRAFAELLTGFCRTSTGILPGVCQTPAARLPQSATTLLPQKSGSRRSSHRLPFGVGRLKDCSLNRFCGFPVGFIPQRSFETVEISRYKMHLLCKAEALFLRPCRQKCKLPSISPADRSASGSSEPVSGAMRRPLSSRSRAA